MFLVYTAIIEGKMFHEKTNWVSSKSGLQKILTTPSLTQEIHKTFYAEKSQSKSCYKVSGKKQNNNNKTKGKKVELKFHLESVVSMIIRMSLKSDFKASKIK